jgi:hypothetical protein
MIEGVPFLYQTIEGDVYHVADSVTLINKWSAKEYIVAFVDADTVSYAPNHILINPRIQIVLTSPPKSSKQQWMSQYGRLVTMYITDLWFPDEFFLTGLVISLCVDNSTDVLLQAISRSARSHLCTPQKIGVIFRLQSSPVLRSQLFR